MQIWFIEAFAQILSPTSFSSLQLYWPSLFFSKLQELSSLHSKEVTACMELGLEVEEIAPSNLSHPPFFYE